MVPAQWIIVVLFESKYKRLMNQKKICWIPEIRRKWEKEELGGGGKVGFEHFQISLIPFTFFTWKPTNTLNSDLCFVTEYDNVKACFLHFIKIFEGSLLCMLQYYFKKQLNQQTLQNHCYGASTASCCGLYALKEMLYPSFISQLSTSFQDA